MRIGRGCYKSIFVLLQVESLTFYWSSYNDTSMVSLGLNADESKGVDSPLGLDIFQDGRQFVSIGLSCSLKCLGTFLNSLRKLETQPNLSHTVSSTQIIIGSHFEIFSAKVTLFDRLSYLKRHQINHRHAETPLLTVPIFPKLVPNMSTSPSYILTSNETFFDAAIHR